MGESRALNIPRMGDVVLINTGDGVFTGREPLYSHYWETALWHSHLIVVLQDC